MAIDKKAINDFFAPDMAGIRSGGISIPDQSFDVLADLKGGKFKDGAGDSLGEEMPMFILDCKQRYGVAPWESAEDGQDAKPQFYGEIWMVPVGGKLGESRMVCRMVKKLSQFRLVSAAVARCMAEGRHFRQVVWVPRFESASNEYGSYYKFKISPKDPSTDHEWSVLEGIIEVLKADPELTQLRDDSTGLLYLQDLSPDERKALLMSQSSVKVSLPSPTPVTGALPPSADDEF